MIVGIIIAIFLGLGLLLFSIQSLPSLASEAIQAIMEPFLLMVDKMFFFLATIVPILAAVIPLYILRNRDDKIIILGSLYGLALMFIVVAFGLSDQIVSYFQTSWATSWTATLGTLAHVLSTRSSFGCGERRYTFSMSSFRDSSSSATQRNGFRRRSVSRSRSGSQGGRRNEGGNP